MLQNLTDLNMNTKTMVTIIIISLFRITPIQPRRRRGLHAVHQERLQVSQKHPQIEHCYGQHRANRSRHAVMADFGSAQINILTIAGNCKPMQSVIITGAATIVAGIDMGNNYM